MPRFVTFYHFKKVRRFGFRRYAVLMRTDVFEGDSKSTVGDDIVSRHFTYLSAGYEAGRRNIRRHEIAQAVRRGL